MCQILSLVWAMWDERSRSSWLYLFRQVLNVLLVALGTGGTTLGGGG